MVEGPTRKDPKATSAKRINPLLTGCIQGYSWLATTLTHFRGGEKIGKDSMMPYTELQGRWRWRTGFRKGGWGWSAAANGSCEGCPVIPAI